MDVGVTLVGLLLIMCAAVEDVNLTASQNENAWVCLMVVVVIRTGGSIFNVDIYSSSRYYTSTFYVHCVVYPTFYIKLFSVLLLDI